MFTLPCSYFKMGIQYSQKAAKEPLVFENYKDKKLPVASGQNATLNNISKFITIKVLYEGAV